MGVFDNALDWMSRIQIPVFEKVTERAEKLVHRIHVLGDNANMSLLFFYIGCTISYLTWTELRAVRHQMRMIEARLAMSVANPFFTPLAISASTPVVTLSSLPCPPHASTPSPPLPHPPTVPPELFVSAAAAQLPSSTASVLDDTLMEDPSNPNPIALMPRLPDSAASATAVPAPSLSDSTTLGAAVPIPGLKPSVETPLNGHESNNNHGNGHAHGNTTNMLHGSMVLHAPVPIMLHSARVGTPSTTTMTDDFVVCRSSAQG